MTHDKSTPGKHKSPDGTDQQPENLPKSDKTSDEKFKIAENVARWALTKFYDDLFMPSQFKDSSGKTAQNAADKTKPKAEQKLAKNEAGNKSDRQNLQKSETRIPIPNLTDARLMGNMAWMNMTHDHLKGGITNTGKFISGKADEAGNSLDHAAASIGTPKPVRDATKATSDFTKHFAGTFVSDAYEMSKLVYNPEDPAVRLAQSWGGMDAAMRISVLRSGQNLVSGVLALGLKGADEMGKRGYMENPAKALYLGNRDLSINTSLEMGKWLAKAKPADWGSLSAHAATFVIGGTEVMAGAKAIKALAQSAKLGEATAILKESDQLAKAGKAAADTLDGTADDAAGNLSKSAPEQDTLPSHEKVTEDLHQKNMQLEEAKKVHEELSSKLVQQQQEVEKLAYKHDLVESASKIHSNKLSYFYSELKPFDLKNDKMLQPSEEEIELALKSEISPLLDEDIEHSLYDVHRTKKKSKQLKADFRHAFSKESIPHPVPDAQPPLDEAFVKVSVPKSVEESDQQLELIKNNTSILQRQLDATDVEIKKLASNIASAERLLVKQNLELKKAKSQLEAFRNERNNQEVRLTYSSMPDDWCFDDLPAAATAERAQSGAYFENSSLQTPTGSEGIAILEVSASHVKITIEHYPISKTLEPRSYLYDFNSEKLAELEPLANRAQFPGHVYNELRDLILSHQANITLERLKHIPEKLEIDWRAAETIPEDYGAF